MTAFSWRSGAWYEIGNWRRLPLSLFDGSKDDIGDFDKPCERAIKGPYTRILLTTPSDSRLLNFVQ